MLWFKGGAIDMFKEETQVKILDRRRKVERASRARASGAKAKAQGNPTHSKLGGVRAPSKAQEYPRHSWSKGSY
ncbi:unnamed protein product [Prunus armeniaca]|uniref:Uncharacterized protein n=1 Tax=Prunus armeniaca TaxID=36596 RepID=A0A6J5WHF5_PRUAR|nr:unnamed protein product [Prunus armeniaca]CAB4299317.1 unnamed protein product [Prunus armeniaca]